MFQDPQTQKNVANFFKILGNPYRLQIVNLLMAGEKNVTELNGFVKVSQPALSQHLSKLHRAGMVGFRRDRRQIFYFLSNPNLVHVLRAMVDALPAHTPAASSASRTTEVA
jgi:ArsR family transcriptional regulator, virulence genes transcriptional regulator